MQNKRFTYLLLIAAINLLPGCATINETTGDREQQDFADYAEDVFRRQNNATSEIMMLSPDDLDNAAQYETLLSAEKNMQSACELLNDYAARVENGETANIFVQARVGNAVNNCDLATKKLEHLFEEFDLASADVNSGTQ